MAKKYYNFRVPEDSETNNPALSAEYKVETKFNRVLDIKCIKNNGNMVEFEYIKPNDGDIKYAYPSGDYIMWKEQEFKLKKLTFFRGLYNDYNISPKDGICEVMLTLEKSNDASHKMFIFFLVSKDSNTKSGFFDSFSNPGTGKAIPVDPGAIKKIENFSIVDLIPKSRFIHTFEDIGRYMNEKISPNDANTTSTVIILQATNGLYKYIPLGAEDGSIFSGSDYRANGPVYGDVRKIQLNTKDPEQGCAVDFEVAGIKSCNAPLPLKWKVDGEEREDKGNGHNDILIIAPGNKYKRIVNPFVFALAIGGQGSVLTSCYEVELDPSGIEVNADKNVPAHQDIYKIPNDYWFKPMDDGKSEDDLKKEKAAMEKFWFQPGEPGFYILMVIGILIVVVLFYILFKEIQIKYLPKKFKEIGIDAAGPK